MVGAEVTDWTINLGRYETGADMVLPVPGWGGAHWLVGASTGAGKTWTIKLALAKLMHEYGDQIAFAACDPDFVNYKTFAPRASVIAFGAEMALPMLKLVEAEMVRRFKLMWELDIEEWSPEEAHRIGPYLITLIEEFKAVSSAPKPPAPRPGQKAPKSAVDRVVTLAQRCRKTGGGLILATQFPNVATIPNDVLAQCAVRWCGRTQEPEQTEAVLGSRRFPCHDPAHPKGIPMNLPGVAYVNDGFTVRRGRTDGIKPDVFARLAEKHAVDRHDFGWTHQLLPNDLAPTMEGSTA
jgi:DNA segregation ATPase FtsK/SpoIIIE-like protein